MVGRVCLAHNMSPKTTPRRSQNESKIKTKNASLFYRSWTRLGAALRRSWAHLGVDFGDFSLENVGPREHRHFWKNTASRRILCPTWPDLGSQKGATRSPRRAKNEPKTSPKLTSKSIRQIIEKWTSQGSMPRFGPHTFEPRGPVGGGLGGFNQSTKDPYPRSSTPMGRWPGEFTIYMFSWYVFLIICLRACLTSTRFLQNVLK